MAAWIECNSNDFETEKVCTTIIEWMQSIFNDLDLIWKNSIV